MHHQTTSTPIPPQAPIAQLMLVDQVQDDDQVPFHNNHQEQDHTQGQEQESAIIDDEP